MTMPQPQQFTIPEHMQAHAKSIDYNVKARAPVAFLEYQKKWVADKSRVKINEKSRRIGLTWAEAADNVLTAGAQSGDDVWYIGYNKDMAIEYILDCAQWTRHFNQAAEAIELRGGPLCLNNKPVSISVI